jgi:hypothetical protein
MQSNMANHHHELDNDHDYHHEQRHGFGHVALHKDDGTVLERLYAKQHGQSHASAHDDNRDRYPARDDGREGHIRVADLYPEV